MLYHHLYFLYEDNEGKECNIWEFNYDEKSVKQTFATPYMKGRAILIGGEFIPASHIKMIDIYRSTQLFEKLALPNGKSPAEEENYSYIRDCFGRKKVKGVGLCTDEFIISPPRKELRKIPTKPLGKKEKVFIVHGRDETQALRLQKYLTRKLKIHAEMFEDFKEESSSSTIIEQLEYIRDNVGYSFVIVMPDDLGCLRKEIDNCRAKILLGKENIKVETVCELLDKFNTRARQNVVFEHGLFIGALGRDRVCCLLQKDTKEKPSDIDGILYVSFNKSVKETFTEITGKLRKLGLIA